MNHAPNSTALPMEAWTTDLGVPTASAGSVWTGLAFLAVAVLANAGVWSCMKMIDGWTIGSVAGVTVLTIMQQAAVNTALLHMSASDAYVLWGGVGAVLMALIDMFVFKTAIPFNKAVLMVLMVGLTIAMTLMDDAADGGAAVHPAEFAPVLPGTKPIVASNSSDSIASNTSTASSVFEIP